MGEAALVCLTMRVNYLALYVLTPISQRRHIKLEGVTHGNDKLHFTRADLRLVPRLE
jgi:hypothetical protein